MKASALSGNKHSVTAEVGGFRIAAMMSVSSVQLAITSNVNFHFSSALHASVAALSATESELLLQYMIRLLALEECADTIVGNNLMRGVSGGQRKRVTTGEMTVG